LFWKKQTENDKIFLDFQSSSRRNAFRYKHGEINGPEIAFLGRSYNYLISVQLVFHLRQKTLLQETLTMYSLI